MTEDEAAQQARARELRAEIERLKHGSPEGGDAESPPVEQPEAAPDAEGQPPDATDPASDAEAESEATEPTPGDATSVRDWINKRMAETPFEEEPAHDGESPGGSGTSGEKDAHKGDQG